MCKVIKRLVMPGKETRNYSKLDLMTSSFSRDTFYSMSLLIYNINLTRLHGSTVEYTMTIAIGNYHAHSGSTNSQYVTIKGTLGETEEKRCDADFTRRGEEVTCTVNSKVYIGSYRCVRWRTSGDDGWNLDKVRSFKLRLGIGIYNKTK